MDIATRWIDRPDGVQVLARSPLDQTNKSTVAVNRPTLSGSDNRPSDEERLRAVVDTAMQELDRTIALKRRGQALTAALRNRLDASLDASLVAA